MVVKLFLFPTLDCGVFVFRLLSHFCFYCLGEFCSTPCSSRARSDQTRRGGICPCQRTLFGWMRNGEHTCRKISHIGSSSILRVFATLLMCCSMGAKYFLHTASGSRPQECHPLVIKIRSSGRFSPPCAALSVQQHMQMICCSPENLTRRWRKLAGELDMPTYGDGLTTPIGCISHHCYKVDGKGVAQWLTDGS